MEIKDLLPIVAVHSILVRLKFSVFSMSFAEKPTKTMAELLAWLAKFINMEKVEVMKC